MRLLTLLWSLLFVAVAVSAIAPRPLPQARTNADALRRGLPLKKARFCDVDCQRNRLARRAKASTTSIPDRGVQYRKTCDVTFALPSYLIGTCKDSDQVVHDTSINLNGCVTFTDGTLTCKPGGFNNAPGGGPCYDCTVNGETMNCMCPDNKGKLTKASINLNTCVGNYEGQLYCDKHQQ